MGVKADIRNQPPRVGNVNGLFEQQNRVINSNRPIGQSLVENCGVANVGNSSRGRRSRVEKNGNASASSGRFVSHTC